MAQSSKVHTLNHAWHWLRRIKRQRERLKSLTRKGSLHFASWQSKWPRANRYVKKVGILNQLSKNVREGLLRVKKNNRLCVLRAADDSRYDVKDDKTVYCEFVKMRYKKSYKKKFESLCEAE